MEWKKSGAPLPRVTIDVVNDIQSRPTMDDEHGKDGKRYETGANSGHHLLVVDMTGEYGPTVNGQSKEHALLGRMEEATITRGCQRAGC